MRVRDIPDTAEMKTSRKARTAWLLGPLLIGILTPALIIFCLEVRVGDIAPSEALRRIAARQFPAGDDLFRLALIGLIPFAALSGICSCAAYRLSSTRLLCLGTGGLLGILGLLVPMHIAAWYPLYDPGPSSASASIATGMAPVYGLFTLSVGVGLGWLVSLAPLFRRDPAARIEAGNASEADRARQSSALIHLSQGLESRFWKVDFEQLTRPEQVFRCIWDLETEVRHGGFRRYYSNPSGDTAIAVVKALETIGAGEAAGLVRRANALFPKGSPARDREVREAQLQAIPPGQQFAALDDQFVAHPDDLNGLLYDYVMSHRDEITGI